jgi:hypothetical protein
MLCSGSLFDFTHKGAIVSHIVTAQTSIQSPNLDLLRQACEIVAANHGGKVSDHYLNFSEQKRSTSLHLAIIVPSKLHRGLGLDIDRTTKKLVFKGDPWMADTLFNQIQQEIIQTYVSLATIQALQAMGYTAQAEDAGQGNVAIRGTIYA